MLFKQPECIAQSLQESEAINITDAMHLRCVSRAFQWQDVSRSQSRHVDLGAVRHCKHVAGAQQRHTVLNVDGSILFKSADGVGADVVGWH